MSTASVNPTHHPDHVEHVDRASQADESSLVEREKALARLESALAQRKDELDRREAALAEVEKHSVDLKEANAHLVMATLAAQKLEEEGRKTKRRQDEFLAMLAHELRNPLAPIRSAVDLIERLHTVDPQLRTIHEVVRRQVEHMARLLDDLLDASRVISGKVTLKRQPTMVSDFVDQAVEICRALIDAQHQRLCVHLPAAPLYVDGDPTRLAQIIGNLVHNAAKYTPDGGSITVSAQANGGSIVLKVTDNGNGISQEALPHIFDLFTQEERSLSRSQGGLGIGLTVVRTMVEQHGGTVRVQSKGLGAGSEFTLTFPRLDSVTEPAVEETASRVFKPACVLVVDDNVDASKMLAMLLEMSGYVVEVAADGPSALNGFERHPAQIVVCDIGLPGMTGYEVAQHIRQNSKGNTDTTAPAPLLIALTGYDGEADRAHALACGFDHHMAKPVDFEILLKLIERA
jgi:signal transduction histidine kinase/ActR/RegA family two-component response regulator